MIGDDSFYSNKSSKLELPIDKHQKSILYLLEKHRVLIVVGETGSGKSTRIPQILFSSGCYNENKQKDESTSTTKEKMVICITQPRRIAAIQLARRVSENLNCNLGSTVGYAVRFKDVTDSEQTMIKFMTDGLLLKEILFDPLLSKYSVIMVDEVHERNLNTDLLLGCLKCIMMKRKDLKIIVCSATMNVDSMTKFFTYNHSQVCSEPDTFKRPAVLCVQGKSYPVKVYYRKEPVPNYMDASVETAINIHENNRLASGKILIFLTGQDEVDYVHERLIDFSRTISSRLDLKKLQVFPLYASLKHEEISKAFESYGRNTRVCIVATNVAETSLTIDDVAFVIDSGFTKIKIYDHKTGMDSLIKVPISKSSAKQRAGRAGRTRSGIVYRLYREEDYDRLDEYTVPDVQKSSLTETVMMLKSLGVSNLQQFPLVSALPEQNLEAAREILYALQAIDEESQLTSSGHIMANFNLDPKLSKILVSLESSNCTLEACRIAAMLQVKEIFVKPGRHASSLWTNSNLTKICVSEGDLPSYLNIINGFINSNMNSKWAERRSLNHQALLSAVEISSKLESKLKKCGIKITSCNGRVGIVQRSMVSGLFSNAAYLHPCGDYKTVRGDETIYVHPTSVFHEMVERPQNVVFVEILNTTRTYMRHIMSIEQNWLLEAAPHYYNLLPIIDYKH